MSDIEIWGLKASLNMKFTCKICSTCYRWAGKLKVLKACSSTALHQEDLHCWSNTDKQTLQIQLSTVQCPSVLQKNISIDVHISISLHFAKFCNIHLIHRWTENENPNIPDQKFIIYHPWSMHASKSPTHVLASLLSAYHACFLHSASMMPVPVCSPFLPLKSWIAPAQHHTSLNYIGRVALKLSCA